MHNLVRAAPLKSGASSGVSDHGKSFPVTAATAIVLDGESGICLRVKIRNPHPERAFRTGERVEGDVHVFSSSQPGPVSLDIASLTLRIYFESRTTFWQLQPDRPGKPSVIQRFVKMLRHEVHRGVVPLTAISASWPMDTAFTIPFTDSLLGRSHAALSFSFAVPRKMDITESSDCDGAPRGLCSFERCPPPTFRDSPEGSVEWVAEAIMTLSTGLSPQIDERMLNVSVEDCVVSRLVFPVLPARPDVIPLRDEPFFGDDLGADLLGARFRAYDPNEGEEGLKGKLATMGQAAWESYAKMLSLNHGHLVKSELYVPAGATISRDASTFEMCLFLEHVSAQSNNSRLFRKPKPVALQRVRYSLRRSIYTRGGPEIKPLITSAVVRQYDMDVGQDGKPGIGVPSNESRDPLKIKLQFSLQAEEKQSTNTSQPMIPIKALVPSFRTPNIQLEYVLILSLYFSEDKAEYPVARFPLQIIP